MRQHGLRRKYAPTYLAIKMTNLNPLVRKIKAAKPFKNVKPIVPSTTQEGVQEAFEKALCATEADLCDIFDHVGEKGEPKPKFLGRVVGMKFAWTRGLPPVAGFFGAVSDGARELHSIAAMLDLQCFGTQRIIDAG